MIRTAALLLLATALGCGDDDGEGSGDPSSEHADPAAAPEEPREGHGEPAERPPSERHAVRLTRAHGEVEIDGEAAQGGAGIAPGARIVTADGAKAVLDRRGGGRIELGPSTTAILGRAADHELILVRGRARGILPPEGNSRRPPLRIGAPAASAQLGGSGDVWVQVAPDGQTWIATLSGRAEVTRGVLGDDGRPVERNLVAGHAVRVDDALPDEPAAGPTRDEDAPGAAAEALGAGAEPDPAVLGARLAEAVTVLREVLGRLEEEAQEGDRLAQRHRTTEGLSREEARAVQRDLVAHSQRVLRLRDAALARWERARALAGLVRLAGSEPDPDPAALEDRTLRALGVDPEAGPAVP